MEEFLRGMFFNFSKTFSQIRPRPPPLCPGHRKTDLKIGPGKFGASVLRDFWCARKRKIEVAKKSAWRI